MEEVPEEKKIKRIGLPVGETWHDLHEQMGKMFGKTEWLEKVRKHLWPLYRDAGKLMDEQLKDMGA